MEAGVAREALVVGALESCIAMAEPFFGALLTDAAAAPGAGVCARLPAADAGALVAGRGAVVGVGPGPACGTEHCAVELPMGVRLTPTVGFGMSFCFAAPELWLLSCRREWLEDTACFVCAPAVVALGADAERLEAAGGTEALGASRDALLGAEMRAVEAVVKAPRLSRTALVVGLRVSRAIWASGLETAPAVEWEAEALRGGESKSPARRFFFRGGGGGGEPELGIEELPEEEVDE